MKKVFLLGFLIFVFLFSIFSYAEDEEVIPTPTNLCSDSDDGPVHGRNPSSEVLTTRGSTKYGLNSVFDVCVVSMDADVQIEESFFLKEYYCHNDKREFEIYDCRKFGFEKCIEGVCVGTGSSSEDSSNIPETVERRSHCGNQYLEEDLGEECDPPGSLCLDGDYYGICLDDCTCNWKNKDKETEVIPNADEDLDLSEEEDENVLDEETSASDYDVNEKSAEEKKEDPFPIPEIEIPDVGEVKDFNNDSGIKVTRGISGFFKKIFSWFIDLF
jgi:hypothetical protein